MTPVYMSPNIDQIELMQTTLHEQGIETSTIPNRIAVSNEPHLPTSMHELWLKEQSDHERAKTIITREEFNMLRRDMANSAYKKPDVTETQPVDVRKLYGDIKPVNQGHPLPPTDTTKDRWIPINLVHVFKRLGKMLGFAESDMELNKFYDIQKPWDGGDLMKSVDALKKKCRTPANTDS